MNLKNKKVKKKKNTPPQKKRRLDGGSTTGALAHTLAVPLAPFSLSAD